MGSLADVFGILLQTGSIDLLTQVLNLITGSLS